VKRKAFKRERARVNALAEKWIKPIGLAWWTIDIRYWASKREWSKEHSKDAAMTCLPDWRYRTATIDVDLQAARRVEDDKLERWFVHELAHVFLDEMCGVPDQHNHGERVAMTVADALIWARHAGKG
jgi:hypothetical protein